MGRILLMLTLTTVVYAQETQSRVKIDRRAESVLATLFDKLPDRIDVFMTADSIYTVEAIYESQKLSKKLTLEEYRDLMTRIPPKMVTLENARVPYLIGQTLLGLGVYSWGIPLTFGMEDKGAAVVGLFTPLAYASTQFLLTRGKRISGGAVYGAFVGGLEGGVHGGLLFKSVRGVFPVSLGENIFDFALGQTVGFTSAMYQRKFNYCSYAYYHYVAIKTLIVDWDDWESGDDIWQIGTALSLAEGYASLFLSKNVDYLTYGDALFELRAAVLGAEALPLLLATFDLHRQEQTNERIYATISLVGHGLGYLLGKKLTRDYDLSGAAGVLTWILPYLAHGATGGLAALTESEGLLRSYPAIFLTMDLALTYVCYRAFAQKATRVGKVDVPKFNMEVNPMCFLFKNNRVGNVPIVTVSYHF